MKKRKKNTYKIMLKQECGCSCVHVNDYNYGNGNVKLYLATK